MRYGFYTDLDELREEYDCSDFGFLENEIQYKGLTPHDFLHGYCFEFARYLNLLYHYPIECIYAEDDSLIHAYCVIEKNNKSLFIDIRGCTDDWDEFIDDFADFMTYYDEPNYYIEKPKNIPPLCKEDNVYLKDVFAAAKCFHDENNDFYDEKYW
jgi:hypothetical protein